MAAIVQRRGWCLSSSATKSPEAENGLKTHAGALAIPGLIQLMHQTANAHLPANCSICRAFDDWLEAMGGAVPIENVEAFLAEVAKDEDDKE